MTEAKAKQVQPAPGQPGPAIPGGVEISIEEVKGWLGEKEFIIMMQTREIKRLQAALADGRHTA